MAARLWRPSGAEAIYCSISAAALRGDAEDDLLQKRRVAEALAAPGEHRGRCYGDRGSQRRADGWMVVEDFQSVTTGNADPEVGVKF